MKNLEEKENKNIFKVFFIISNLSSLDKDIEYSLNDKDNIFSNFKNIKKSMRYKQEEFTIYVYSFEFIKEKLKEIYKDKNAEKYIAKINLKIKSRNLKFEGIIYFKEYKNNFIYNFQYMSN